jgi:DNA replication protein DnaC
MDGILAYFDTRPAFGAIEAVNDIIQLLQRLLEAKKNFELETVLITSNLVFSQWDKIFQDPMTTMAAIDRLIHHSIILEFCGESHPAMSHKAQRHTKG